MKGLKNRGDERESSLERTFERIGVKSGVDSVVKGKKSTGGRRKKERRRQALERQELREQRSVKEQLELLEKRSGESCKEKERLLREEGKCQK